MKARPCGSLWHIFRAKADRRDYVQHCGRFGWRFIMHSAAMIMVASCAEWAHGSEDVRDGEAAHIMAWTRHPSLDPPSPESFAAHWWASSLSDDQRRAMIHRLAQLFAAREAAQEAVIQADGWPRTFAESQELEAIVAWATTATRAQARLRAIDADWLDAAQEILSPAQRDVWFDWRGIVLFHEGLWSESALGFTRLGIGFLPLEAIAWRTLRDPQSRTIARAVLSGSIDRRMSMLRRIETDDGGLPVAWRRFSPLSGPREVDPAAEALAELLWRTAADLDRACWRDVRTIADGLTSQGDRSRFLGECYGHAAPHLSQAEAALLVMARIFDEDPGDELLERVLAATAAVEQAAETNIAYRLRLGRPPHEEITPEVLAPLAEFRNDIQASYAEIRELARIAGIAQWTSLAQPRGMLFRAPPDAQVDPGLRHAGDATDLIELLGASATGLSREELRAVLEHGAQFDHSTDARSSAIIAAARAGIELEQWLVEYRTIASSRTWPELSLLPALLSRSEWTTTEAMQLSAACDTQRLNALRDGNNVQAAMHAMETAVDALMELLPPVSGKSLLDVVDSALIAHVLEAQARSLANAERFGDDPQLIIDIRQAYDDLRSISRRAIGWLLHTDTGLLPTFHDDHEMARWTQANRRIRAMEFGLAILRSMEEMRER